MRCILLLIVFATLVVADKISYKDYKVFKVMLKAKVDIKELKHLVKSNKKYTFWTLPSITRPTTIMVSPESVYQLNRDLTALNLNYSTMIDDVQTLIDRQLVRKNNDKSFDWTSYHTLDEIHNWLDDLAKKYPSKVKIVIAGRSYEGRPIKGVKLSFGKHKPGVFIEAGIHANEWISPATATYLLNEFLNSKEKKVRELAEAHDWYVFPSLNPDGYVYTHTTDRMWRKSRSRSSANCSGVDLNRNWDYMWMKVGASNDTCSNMYAGKYPFSEIESRSISQYIRSIKDELFAYIDFHSFSQLLMVPYGHTKEHLDNFNETYAIGLKTVKTLAKRYGTNYTVGNIAEAIYEASGSSLDWVKANFKLPIAFCYELRDQGKYGMLLPPEQIIPNSQEILDSLITLFEEAKNFGYPKLHNKTNSL